MITQGRVLETLERFNIDEEQLNEWEEELNLEVPVDRFGNKVYSPLHVNLFKNIKKHLALGRSLSEIKRMVVLPSSEQPVRKDNHWKAKNVETKSFIDLHGREERHLLEERNREIEEGLKSSTLSKRLLTELKPVVPLISSSDSERTALLSEDVTAGDKKIPLVSPFPQITGRSLKRFASTPARITTSNNVGGQEGPNAGLLMLIDRLMGEKDELQAKLVKMEKQKVHLYQTNEMFQQRVKELAEEIESLKEQLRVRENFKLIDDKSRLQKQVIEAEQHQIEAEKKLSQLKTEVNQLRDSLANRINSGVFVGNWLEEAELTEVSFDNFGINIESRRNRMFKITHKPERFFGHAAIIETTYDYQTNTLWKRTETLIISIIHENHLQGEMIAEYVLDGTPVAKAIYQIKCYRNGVKTE